MPEDTVKFLLVDDVEENLLALDGLLRRDGLEFKLARSGREALELLLVHDFALALLDVQLPDMDGFELAELMRGTERTRRVPIIFLTAVATDERRRFMGYESGAVDYLIKPIDPHILRRKAEVFFDLDRQRRELVRQRDDLRDSEERFRRSVLQAPTPMMLFDDRGEVLVVNDEWLNSTGYSGADVATLSKWTERAHGGCAADVLAYLEQVISKEPERSRAEFEVIVAGGANKTWEFVAASLGHTPDRRGLFVWIAHDITDRKLAERTQQLLIGELNHRVKNTLATVQAIAQQTLRRSAEPAAFAASFTGRIQALSRAHSMLSDEIWKGADLGELIRDQLLHGTTDESRLSIEGPRVRLEPQAALHVALMLHELGTNATKYGALSGARGRVLIKWSADGGELRLSWTECEGPVVSAPSKRGFGTTLIEQTAKMDGGDATVEYRNAGVAWLIRLPLRPPAIPHAARPGTAKPVEARINGVTAHPAAGSLANSPGQLSGKRLLVVEDEPLIALEMTARLTQAGAAVVGPAGTADEAFRMIESGTLDGALLDGNLHGKSVGSIATALKARNVPFAFVTGYGRDSLPGDFGGTAILTKPFTEAQLVETARHLLGGLELQ